MSNKTLQPIKQQTVVFYNDEVTAVMVEEDGQPQVYVPVRPLCENLGIAWRSQNLRIKRDPVLSEVVRSGIVTIPEVGRREMLLIPLQYLNGWLFGINATRVKPEIKEQLILYQKECYAVLAEAFSEGRLTADPTFDELLHTDSEAVQAYQMLQALVKLARNQIILESRIEQHDRALAEYGIRLETIEADMGQEGRYITESQATQISQSIRSIALLMSKRTGQNEYGRCWGEFYRKFGVSKYRHLPAAKFDGAMQFLEDWHTNLTDEAF